jgi:hypothetical protein
MSILILKMGMNSSAHLGLCPDRRNRRSRELMAVG